MNQENLVVTEYYNKENNMTCFTPGELQEGSNHIILISECIEGIDLYTYTIIPKAYIKKINQLKPILDCTEKKNLKILDTHSGYGSLTEFYKNYGDVSCYDIKKEKIATGLMITAEKARDAKSE